MAEQVERKSITDLIPDQQNANLGTERGLRLLDDSLQEVGLGRSVVTDKNGILIAGNKTTERAIDRGFEDAIIVHTKGKELVVVQRDDLDLVNDDDQKRARALAYYDNRVGEADLQWSPQQLEADRNAGIPAVDKLWKPDELIELGVNIEGMDSGRSDGSLLALTDVTIAEPKTDVQPGDVYQLGRHFLICMDVVTEAHLWSKYLTEDCWFLPYPGPYAAISLKADEHIFVMVQPIPYIAGHVIDKYLEVNDSGQVTKLY